MISVKDVSKIFSASGSAPKTKALDRVSFTMGEKGLVFILGKSGSGKTTLLRLLGGIIHLTSGDILVNGTSLSDLDREGQEKYRNTCIGFVFQDFMLLEDLSVAENVALSLSLQGKKDNGEVQAALAKVGMDKYSKRKCLKLSGGQRQRVAIARAIVKDPTFILADEPTGSLDAATGTAIMELLKEISKQKLIVVVTHDRSFAERYGDRLIELSDGKIVSDSKEAGENGAEYPPLELKKPRLPFKSVLRMSSKSLRRKGARLAASIFLSATTFTLFGLISATKNINQAKAVATSISLSKNKDLLIYNRSGSSLIFKSEKNKIEKAAGENVFIKDVYMPQGFSGDVEVADKGRQNHGVPSTRARKVYDFSSLNSLAFLNDSDLLKTGFALDGKLPETVGEIAISKLLFDSLARHVGLKTYKDVKISLGQAKTIYQVVGVIDNHFDTSAYEHLRDRDMNRGTKLRERLIADLENSFATTAFISKEEYETKSANILSEIHFYASYDRSAYTFDDLNINGVASSLDDLYGDYKKSVRRSFAMTSPDFDFDNLTGEIKVGRQWLKSHGYVTSDDYGSTYSVTLSDDDGVYVVTYIYDETRGVFVRSSEAKDPRAEEAEAIDFQYLSKQEFLDEYFITADGQSVNEFLDDNGEFVDLAEGEIVSAIDLNSLDSKEEDFLKSWKKGDTSLLFTNNEIETNIKRIRAIYNNPEDEMWFTPTFEHLVVASPKDYSFLKDNSECFSGFKAICSGNPSSDERFLSYFMGKEKRYISNSTTALLEEVDIFFHFPIDILSLFAVVFLAVISALILNNYISISLSYSKRERGILMALGASNKDLLSVYLFEALLIALLTGTISIIGSGLACLLLNLYISAHYSIAANIFVISLFEPLVILGSAIASSLIAAFIPIWRNRNIEPIDILKA